MEVTFHGPELYRIWQAGKSQGLTQRKLASYLDMSFNALHGKIWREQERIKVVEEKPLEHRIYEPVGLRAAVFDIECMDFATGGIQNHLVCVSILPLDGPVYTHSISFEDNRDDRRVLQESVDHLSEFDILIGHNVAAFDFNWLNSRLVYHGLPQMSKKFLYYDTYQAARRQALKADRKSLAFLCDFFRIDAVKTSILPVSWSMIDSPAEPDFNEALTDIVYHCEEDVKANRKLFDAMWPIDHALTGLPVTKKW